MATAQLNGIDVSYEDSGGDGPALLFSHGFLMDHSMFDAQVDAFQDEYRCVRWDARGFGKTRADGAFTYWDSAADAIALLDHLGIDRAVFIGMSQGGFLSLRAALAAPERVRAMVLIDSAADVDDPATLTNYEGMLHVFATGTDEERDEVFQIVAGLILADDELAQEWIPRWRAIETDQLVAAGGALLDRDDLTDRVGEISCPILSIHGSEDQAIDTARAKVLAASAHDHRGVVEIDGAAHAPNMTHADEVNDALRRFLESL